MRSRNALLAVVFAGASTSFFACGNSTTTGSEAGADAGHDSGTPPPGVDAGQATDAGHVADAGQDAGQLDAGAHDAGDGGQVDGGGPISGSDDGVQFSSVESLSADTTDDDDAFFTGTTTTLYVVNFSNSCDDLGESLAYPSTASLLLQLAVNVQSNGEGGFTGDPVTGAATFSVSDDDPIVGTNAAMGEIDSYDSLCNSYKSSFVSGTVTVTQVTENGIVGSLELMSADGGTFSGTFSTANCGNLDNVWGDTVACTL